MHDNRKRGTSMELLEKILSKQNLNLAYKQVYKNKGASGVDGVTVDELFSYIKEYKEEILWKIRNRKYKPLPVRRVYIPKENGKLRKLGIPSVIDRVLQQAIVQVLAPIYEEQFSNSSFGFRPNRCCEQAVIKALECFNDGYDWIVDIDLQSFFDEVNQDKLMAIIHRTIKDDVISLIRKFLQSGVMEKGIIQETKKGTPQGGNLSPLISNIMLNELDKELEKRGLNFVRYADDCLIMVKSEKAANRVMESITTFITKKLGLKVNLEKSKIARPNQIKYLGFGFYKKINQNKWRPKPHIKSVQKFKTKLRGILIRSRSISLDERFLKLKQLIYGWVNYFRIADMKGILTSIDQNVRRKLRVIIWKQWKKIRKRYTCLRKLGITHRDAYVTANSRRGYYHVSATRVLQTAISKERLNKRGLVNSLDHYLKVHMITN